MFTGTIKDKFELWYFKNYCNSSLEFYELMPHHKKDIFGWFYSQKIQMQQGVMMHFLDEIGIECFYCIGVSIQKNKREGVVYNAYYKNQCIAFHHSNTRIEAFIKIIEKICELYNSNYFQDVN